MAQFTITAHSAKANVTVSNTDTKRFPSPAEFGNLELAQEHATIYAKNLNWEDHQQVWDWVGNAAPV
jgi:hypothetical protein